MEQTNVPYRSSLEHLIAGIATIDLRLAKAISKVENEDPKTRDPFHNFYCSRLQAHSLLNQTMEKHLKPSLSYEEDKAAPHESVDIQHWNNVVRQAYKVWHARTEVSEAASVPMILKHLIDSFQLSPQEIDIFLVALLPEIDLCYERIMGFLQDDLTRKRPSVDLVLNLLSDDFTENVRLRSFFLPNQKLIQSGLIQLHNSRRETHPSLLNYSVQVSPTVVASLLGHKMLDPQIQSFAHLESTSTVKITNWIDPEITNRILQAIENYPQAQPLFNFVGVKDSGKQLTAYHCAASGKRPLLIVDTPQLYQQADWQHYVKLIVRDACLCNAWLYWDNWDKVASEDLFYAYVFRQSQMFANVTIFANEKKWLIRDDLGQRPIFTTHFQFPDVNQRFQVWKKTLVEKQISDDVLSRLANQFRFTRKQIKDSVQTAHNQALWRETHMTAEDLFDACRQQSHRMLNRLAVKVQPRYSWSDIILPTDIERQLKEMAAMVRMNGYVLNTWGFGQKVMPNPGVYALFAGEPGTGKTMAADVIAGDLGLDLYKVNLATVVSKYIGETEKNLERIFNEAETSNVILFFDEADALFGKRSQVNDSHDRYANLEVSYLLQRLEVYAGIVILATNYRSNVDLAFLRRLHFLIEFPFPDPKARERIWRANLPSQTPLSHDVDFAELARRFRLAGGNIRNMTLMAAFLAAEADEPVSMKHLLHAAQREHQKMGRMLDTSLFISQTNNSFDVEKQNGKVA